ncbi:MAG: extracellular solute-binding protein [Desulfosarcinaceae bacterium]|nr:extracellular solute-binding protein [Desulfosarcinaceae bacterium]
MRATYFLLAAAICFMAAVAQAGCTYENTVSLKTSTAAFQAWKAVTGAMAECGNVESELSQEVHVKQAAGFATNPSLYHIGGVMTSSIVPLVNKGLVRPLDDLIAKYGQQLKPNQLMKFEGRTLAIAMMVNAQHLMYREDILNELGIAVPTTYTEVLTAAEKIKKAGVVDYPLGGSWKTTWLEFVNMYLGYGGGFFKEGNLPAVNNAKGVAALEMMRKLTAYMDPEYLVADSTYVQQQFQQGKIAMANFWASRAGAMDDPKESQVVGKVKMAAAPAPEKGGIPASTLWWDGIVIAKNISEAEAEAAFRVAMEGLDKEMVQANRDLAVWLIEGYEPGPAAKGAAETAAAGARPYPASTKMGLMQTAIANNIADFLTGRQPAKETLANIEASYLTAAKESGIVK